MTTSPGAGARILVVEDEPQVRFALRRYLEESGYAVREVEDGAGALREIVSFKPERSTVLVIG